MDKDQWLERIVKADRIYLESEAATKAYRAARDQQIRKALADGVTRVDVARAIKQANGRGSESGVRWANLRSRDGARTG